MFFHDRGEAPPERATDPEVRRANLRRIGGLYGDVIGPEMRDCYLGRRDATRAVP